MRELDPCRKLTLPKPEGTRSVGKPKLMWLESFEEDLKNAGVRNWRHKSRDRDEWRAILEEAKGLTKDCNARKRLHISVHVRARVCGWVHRRGRVLARV
jgi:hypothetical protein